MGNVFPSKMDNPFDVIHYPFVDFLFSILMISWSVMQLVRWVSWDFFLQLFQDLNVGSQETALLLSLIILINWVIFNPTNYAVLFLKNPFFTVEKILN